MKQGNRKCFKTELNFKISKLQNFFKRYWIITRINLVLIHEFLTSKVSNQIVDYQYLMN